MGTCFQGTKECLNRRSSMQIFSSTPLFPLGGRVHPEILANQSEIYDIYHPGPMTVPMTLSRQSTKRKSSIMSQGPRGSV